MWRPRDSREEAIKTYSTVVECLHCSFRHVGRGEEWRLLARTAVGVVSAESKESCTEKQRWGAMTDLYLGCEERHL